MLCITCLTIETKGNPGVALQWSLVATNCVASNNNNAQDSN